MWRDHRKYARCRILKIYVKRENLTLFQKLLENIDCVTKSNDLEYNNKFFNVVKLYIIELIVTNNIFGKEFIDWNHRRTR